MLSHAASHIDSSRPAISSRRASPAQNPDVGGVPKQHPLIDAMHMMGATMSFPSETEIFGEGEAADYAYQVISGGVRTYKIPATVVARLLASICQAIFSVLTSRTTIPFRPKRSPTRRLLWSSAVC